MTRETIIIINRRRMLADTLDACTQAEIREEVSAALHRKFPSNGHATHCAMEIVDATMEHGMPPRDTGFDGATVLLVQPEKRGFLGEALVAISAVVIAAVAVVALYYAVTDAVNGVMDQVRQGAVEW